MPKHRLRNLVAVATALLFGLPSLMLSTDAHAEDRMKTVVVGLKARRGVEPALGEAMSDIVQGEYAADKKRMVFGRSDIKRLMEFEAEKQLMGCDSDSCLSEIASALDVDRIITGSLDKIGSGYFVVINELESDGVAPIARVQGRVPLDEDKLFRAVADMSRKLLRKSARWKRKKQPGPASATAEDEEDGKTVATRRPAEPEPPPPAEPIYERPQIERGLVVTSASPASVKIGETSYGETPVAIADLPAGDYTVELQPADGNPLLLDVQVFDDGVTTVETEFDQELRPSAEQMTQYQSAKTWHAVGAFGKIGGGAATTLVLAPCASLIVLLAFSNTGSPNIGPGDVATFATCGALSAAGCGIASWGLIDFFFPPEEPRGEGIGTEVLIMPPSGQGDRKHLKIPDNMAH